MTQPGVAREVHVDLGFRPHPYQLEVAHALVKKRFAVLVAHRRWGKTTHARATLLHAALKCERQHPRYAYVTPRLKQTKQIIWLALCDAALRIPGTIKNESELFVELPNKARITLYGGTEGNEEAMRGLYFDGMFFDEVAGIARQTWEEIARPALSDRKGWAVFIGTPKGINFFYELYHRAQSEWKDEWHTALYRADETELPWLPKEELESARRMMRESAYRQEYLCDWQAAVDNALITIDLVSTASHKIMTERDIDYAPKILGVDVARFGDDRSVVIRRQGLAAFHPKTFEGLDNMQLASVVANEIAQWKPDAVFIDAGRGEGVIDRVRQLGHQVTEVNFGGKSTNPRYNNKRTEMWDTMREWLERGGAIPNIESLKSDLCAPLYSFDASGSMVLERKEDLKKRGIRSPDEGDALALTFASPVVPHRTLPQRQVVYDPLLGAEGSRAQRTEYDPLQ